MIKLLSHSVIALTLILGFAPTVRPITVSESNNNLYAQATTTDEEKLATADKLIQEGLKLSQQDTQESSLQAIEKLQQGLKLYQAVKKPYEIASTLFLIGIVYTNLGATEKALESYNQALLLSGSIDNSVGQAYTLNNIGKIYSDLGEQKKALDYYNRALNLHRAVTNPSGEATALKNIGDAYNSLGKKEKALNYYNQVLPIYRELDDLSQEANTLYDIGEIYNSLGEPDQALDRYKQALPIFKGLKNDLGVAHTLNNMGLISRSIGEMEKALDYYNQALAIFQKVQDPNREVIILNNIGRVYDLLANKQQALNQFNKALLILETSDDPDGKAVTLSNLGGFYDELGEKQKALDYHNQALSIFRALKDFRNEGATLNNIGKIYKDLGEQEQALDYFNQALPIFQTIKYHKGKAATFGNIGAAYHDLGDKKKALNYHNQALSILREIKELNSEATILNNIGVVYDDLEEKEEALNYYNQALPIAQKLGDRSQESNIFYSISSIYYDHKNYNIALQNIDRAIEIVEEIRSTITNSDFKASYFATIEDYYKAKIKVLMQLHQQNPNQVYDVLAFETSEQGKARSLLELLEEANIDIRQGVNPELVTEEKRLQNKLDAVEKRRISLCSKDCSDEKQLNQLETERRELLEQYQQIQTQIRSNSPKYAELTQPEPIKLKELQQLLDEDTVLWQYSLANEHSYIWVITKNSFTTHQLPSRGAIETLARKYSEPFLEDDEDKKAAFLSPEGLENLTSTGKELSKLILPPDVKATPKSRVVIVSDGALQYIPFASLPTEDNNLLSNNHQIVNLPSSSVLASLRTNQQDRKLASKKLAVLADPVFSKKTQQEDTEDLGFERVVNAIQDLKLTPLPGTRTEANNILALVVPESQKTSAFGFDANLEFATNPELSNYNIVHFATHGILDSERPELSGIVLSLFDEQGNPQNGFLRLHEVFNLNLPADLVVLSACETGLGKEIRGEGLVGLTRGFIYAGATRVLVSLWKVDDAATAEFMIKFYGFMLQDKLTPAAALNATQKYMQNHSKWSHPYYWAAFTLQGDWVQH